MSWLRDHVWFLSPAEWSFGGKSRCPKQLGDRDLLSHISKIVLSWTHELLMKEVEDEPTMMDSVKTYEKEYKAIVAISTGWMIYVDNIKV